MPRKLKLRLSYSADTHYLTRLLSAVEMDTRHSAEWVAEVSMHLRALAILFMSEAETRVSESH